MRAGAGDSSERVAEAARTACARVLELLRAWLSEARFAETRLIVLTNGAVAAADDEAPDLVATVQVFGNPDPTLPIVTFLTLGIIPTVAKGHDGVRVTLAAPATGRTLEIRIDQKDLVIVGWSGAVLLGSEEWVRASAYNGRMFDRIASELAARAETIETLPLR